jgi:hypothetical protein
MTAEQKLLLEYIQRSQFPGEASTSAELTVDNFDWQQLFKEAQAQSVAVLVAGEVPMSELPADEQARWQEAENRQLVSYIRYMAAQNELTTLLRGAGIPFAVLKGLAAAVYYRDPSKRAMGDIDFIVPPEQFERTKALMIEASYKPTHEDLDNPRHDTFVKNSVHFELHRYFSLDNSEMEHFITDAWGNTHAVRVADAEIDMLPPLGNGIVLLEHIKSHLQSALGLRQVIDWMMYVDRELHDGFWEAEFQAAAREVRLEKLAIVVTRMCQKYLGLTADNITWCADADEQLCDDLIENLLVSGNFGRRNGDGNRVEFVTASIKRDGLFQRLQRSGEANWKAYKKHKWLKPFCWIYQSGRYMNRGIRARRSGKQLRDDIDRANKRNKLLRDLEIV